MNINDSLNIESESSEDLERGTLIIEKIVLTSELLIDVLDFIKTNKFTNIKMINVDIESYFEPDDIIKFPDTLRTIYINNISGKLEKLVLRLISSNPNLYDISIEYPTLFHSSTAILKEIKSKDKILNLSLSENFLEDFPKECLELINLETLNLNENMIIKIPEQISNLKSLMILSLKNNQISKFQIQLLT